MPTHYNAQLLKGAMKLLVLRLLERAPMYGYQMLQHLEAQSEGYFRLGDGAALLAAARTGARRSGKGRVGGDGGPAAALLPFDEQGSRRTGRRQRNGAAFRKP